MVRFQDFPRLVQVDDLGLRLLPVQRSDKVQIVIEHAVFRRLVSLLLQAVEHLGRLRPGGLVHAGFLDLHLELPDIGNLLRMHLIQLALQVLQLLLDGGFLINVLIFLLVGGVCVIRDLGHLEELVDQLLHQLCPAQGAVLRQDLIVFLIARLHPDGEHSRQGPERVHVFHIGRRSSAPLIPLGKLLHGLFRLVKLLFRHLLGHVLDIRPAACHQGDRAVAVDHDAFDVHPCRGVHHRIAVIADLRDGPQQSDRIETLLRPFCLALVLPGNKQNDLLINAHIPGEVAELIPAKIHIRIRRYQLFIYRNNCHINLPP